MKKILYSFIVVAGLFAATSCEDMLMTGNDSMVTDPELDAKTDSVFYALGIAQAMQQLADQYFFIGEMRGELVTTTEHTDKNLRQLADYSATTANKYDSAYVYYKVINNCNYYLKHRDKDLTTGADNVVINEYAAVEAWRAWAYLQLARTYGGNEKGVPFYTEPLTSISQIEETDFPEFTLSQIVDSLAPSLAKYSGLQVPSFGTNAYSVGNPNWNANAAKNINPELIFVPVDVILGEMYLEDGQWLKAAQHYCKYLCDNKLTSDEYTVFRYFWAANLSLDWFAADFEPSYNLMVDGYTQIYENLASPLDVLTYIPMAVSSQRGQTTNIPLAFGYDYYSTDVSTVCPRADEVQIAPSDTYYELTEACDFYYFPKNMNGTTLEPNPNAVKACKMGDGRAVYADDDGTSYRDRAILNRDASDSTKVYISKMKNANVYLFRTSTVYLHLAEALNRLGHPDAAFAILRNGVSTYLEQLVPGAGGVNAPHQYMTQASVDLLTNEVPFLSEENRTVFIPENAYGIHHHGGGFSNAKGVENNMGVKGSQATAVGSKNNLLYLPAPIIGAKMQEISERFNVQVGTTKQDSINAMEDILCDEYAKEFAFEGIRFYDLQRIARHKNEAGLYGSDFGSRWFADKLKGNNPQVDLTNPKNWYMPLQ
ncbi:MAG: RagB/SusD family nutrient uptake outer membrane protein [Bacteroidaceae bacterium]|nr:RagB/SusD family nutrient uptake outer membrane protein [Bacteroidaceae bacterium]